MRTLLRSCLLASVCVIAILLSAPAHGTDSRNIPATLVSADSGWKTLIDTLQVKISYRLADCKGGDRVFVQVENRSNDAVSLSWDDNLVSGGASFTTAGKGVAAVTLTAGQTISGSCDAYMVSGRMLVLPLDMYFQGKDKYDPAALVYTISGFTKAIL